MMESPIDDRVWKYMFHTVAVTASAAYMWSLYREKRDSRSKLNDALKMTKSEDEATALNGIQAIDAALNDDARSKTGVNILSLRNNAHVLAAKLKFRKGSENEVAMNALRLIRKICLDVEGRQAFQAARGYRAVMLCLSEAHKNGHVRLMEEAAKTLDEITQTDPSEVVLPADIPAGSEGAAELAGFSGTVKMLRTLDPTHRVAYLISVTGALANIASLQVGTNAIAKGTEGKLGSFYFLQLLTHSNEAVVDKAARALRFLSNTGAASTQHELIADPTNVKNLTLLLNGSASVQHSVMRIIHVMMHSHVAPKFFETFVAEDGLHSMFRLWTKGNDRQSREMAEALVHMLEKKPFTSTPVRKLMDLSRADIQERRAKDEETRKRQMEQLKQQQMMRQQMMQQMMGGMGGPEMEAMMGDE